MDNNYKYIGVKFATALRPVFEERKGKDYIEFGANNLYPLYLIDLYNESPKHGAIVKGKTNYIYGQGFNNKNKANTQGETWNQVFKKSVLDDELFAGYYLHVIYNLLGAVKDVYHLDFQKVRTNKSMSLFYVKNDWADNKEKMRCYEAFNPSQVDKNNPSQILFVKQSNPKSEVYPLPNYYQGLNYIESDIQVSRHILGNAKDGFVATTLINLNGGEPQEEQKAAVERDLKKKFTGSEGDRVVIMFNRSKDTSADIVPLSSTMLTKEDFTNVNNLITQEIYACHQVTSPILFGIKSESQLGARNEIRDAYEIFNNTYVNERQQAFEEVFNTLIHYTGDKNTYEIIPVEPLGFEFTEAIMSANMTRNEIREKLGLPPDENVDVSGMPVATSQINSNLAGMTGRQFQQLERIKRKYEAGKLTRDQAAMMLKNSFGINDEEVSLFLDEKQEFAEHEDLDFAVNIYSQFGEDANLFEVVGRKTANEKQYFADVKKLSEIESKIITLLKDGEGAESIAKVLSLDVKVVNDAIKSMVSEGVLTKSLKPSLKSNVKTILLKYSYDWKSIVPSSERDTAAHPSRDFCKRIMSLNRFYSRQDIENISLQLGYSVFDRAGGWWTMPDGEHSPSCRHEWQAVTVIKK